MVLLIFLENRPEHIVWYLGMCFVLFSLKQLKHLQLSS